MRALLDINGMTLQDCIVITSARDGKGLGALGGISQLDNLSHDYVRYAWDIRRIIMYGNLEYHMPII